MEKYCPTPEMQEQFAGLLVQEEQRAGETGISDSTQQRKARFANFSLPLNKTPPHLPLFACKCRGEFLEETIVSRYSSVFRLSVPVVIDQTSGLYNLPLLGRHVGNVKTDFIRAFPDHIAPDVF